MGTPVRKKSNGMMIAIACLVVLAIGGLIVTLASDDDGDQTSSGSPSGHTDDPSGGGGSKPGGSGGGSGGGGGLTVPTSPPSTEAPTTETTLEPSQAQEHDCISVTSEGDFVGSGSCSDGSGVYTVAQVVPYTGSCSNPDAPWITSGGYYLCLELNVVQNYCYVFPDSSGFITNSECKVPGTVHVIDIVPGVTNGDYCTSDYQWSHWYKFDAPDEVVCVQKY